MTRDCPESQAGLGLPRAALVVAEDLQRRDQEHELDALLLGGPEDRVVGRHRGEVGPPAVEDVGTDLVGAEGEEGAREILLRGSLGEFAEVVAHLHPQPALHDGDLIEAHLASLSALLRGALRDPGAAIETLPLNVSLTPGGGR